MSRTLNRTSFNWKQHSFYLLDLDDNSNRNALKKMTFPLLYLKPPLLDQTNVPPSGEKGLGYSCQVTVSTQTGYVSWLHRMMTSCRAFFHTFHVIVNLREWSSQTATWEGEKEEWCELQKRGEDAGLPMLVPIKNITLIPVLPAVSGCWEQLRPLSCCQ